MLEWVQLKTFRSFRQTLATISQRHQPIDWNYFSHIRSTTTPAPHSPFRCAQPERNKKKKFYLLPENGKRNESSERMRRHSRIGFPFWTARRRGRHRQAEWKKKVNRKCAPFGTRLKKSFKIISSPAGCGCQAAATWPVEMRKLRINTWWIFNVEYPVPSTRCARTYSLPWLKRVGPNGNKWKREHRMLIELHRSRLFCGRTNRIYIKLKILFGSSGLQASKQPRLPSAVNLLEAHKLT